MARFIDQLFHIFSNEFKQYIFSKRIFIIFVLFTGINLFLSVAAIKYPQKVLEDIIKNKQVSQQEISKAKLTFESARNHPNPRVRYLFSIPPVNLLIFTISWVFLPLIIFILGYSAIAGDVSAKNVQYFLLRVPRVVYFLGKFLATCLAVMSIIVLSNILVLFYAKAKLLPADLDRVVSYMLLFDGYLIVFGFCYIGFIYLMSVIFNRPGIALLMAFVIPVVAGFVRLFKLEYVLPSHYVQYFYYPETDFVLKAVIAYAIFGVVYATAACVVFLRKNLQ